MKNKSILYIIIVTIILIIAIIAVGITVANKNPIKNTEWKSLENGSLLIFREPEIENSFQWTSEDNSTKGAYKIYKKDKAKEFLDKYADEYVKSMPKEVSEDEKWGFKNEINNMKKYIDKSKVQDEKVSIAFVIEEQLESVKINNESLEPDNHIYFAYIDEKDNNTYLYMANVADYNAVTFVKASDYIENENVYDDPPIDNDNTSDKHLSFTYEVPEKYKKFRSEENYVIYSTDSSLKDSIDITILEEVPLKGVIDEYPNYQEFKDGIKAEQRIGPSIKYVYLFENNNNTYLIESMRKDLLMDFVDSIQKK